jgi:pimeloyl-ACP methyl ester carboxylesterase
MGTPVLVWKHIFEELSDRMTIVTWDPRGMYQSEAPPTLDELSFDHQLADALAIIEALGWQDPFVTGSWSMGVQVGLEIYDRMPDRIAGLALINGTFEHVLRTAYGPSFTGPLLRAALRGSVATARFWGPAVVPLMRSGFVGYAMDGLGVSTANRDFVVEVTRAVGGVDPRRYLRTILELDRHSARAILEKVDVPTLVTAGTEDQATPPAVTRELHALIANSEYVEIERGTHYTPLEYPEALNRALEDFFRTRVFPDTW